MVGLTALPAGASTDVRVSTRSGGAETVVEQPHVTKVKLVKGGLEAKVSIGATCVRGGTFAMYIVEVIQDATPAAAPFDAYYKSSEIIYAPCTGRAQRFTVRVMRDASGLWAPPEGRLHKGMASVVIGGEFELEHLVLVEDKQVK